jgi:alkylation response protein AidB-like acyl-CoA dehydrogenase
MSLLTEAGSVADTLIARIEDRAEEIEAQADDNERLGNLNDRTIELLNEIGVSDALVPAEYGGLDLTAYDALRVFDALSYVESSVGWAAMVPGVQGKGLLLLEKETRDKLAVGGYPVIAGQGAPAGRARVVDGGYRISGRWSYGSSMNQANLVMGMALVVDDDSLGLSFNGTPRAIIFYTPKTNVTVDGNWDVLGMRATGSVDYSTADTFVPAENVIENFMTAEAGGDGIAKYLSFTGWTLSVHCAVPLGVGRRLLDELGKFAREHRSRGRLADDARFVCSYGKAQAAYRSARAFMYEAFTDAQGRMDRGEPATRRDYTNMHAATVLLHDVNVKNATFAFRESGGFGLHKGKFQRLYRDIMAMGQHIQASQHKWADISKDYLGEAGSMQWLVHSLV